MSFVQVDFFSCHVVKMQGIISPWNIAVLSSAICIYIYIYICIYIYIYIYIFIYIYLYLILSLSQVVWNTILCVCGERTSNYGSLLQNIVSFTGQNI